MKILWVAIAIFVFIVAMSLRKQKGRRIGGARFNKKEPLTKVEQILYFKLKKALKDEYEILPQVSFSRFLYTYGGTKSDNWRKHSTARQKVIDYLICKRNFEIVTAVELDDSSHTEEKDNERDKILNEAGIKIIRWNVKNMPDEEEIINRIKDAQRKENEINNTVLR